MTSPNNRVLFVYPLTQAYRDTFSYGQAFKENDWDFYALDSNTELHLVVDKIKEFRPAAIIYGRRNNLATISQVVAEKFPNLLRIAVFSGVREHPEEFGGGTIQVAKNCNLVYIKAKGMIPEYRRLCPKTRFAWLPEGIQSSLSRRLQPTPEIIKEYGCDVVFFGSKNTLYKTPIPYGRIGLMDFLIEETRKRNINFKLIAYEPITPGQKTAGRIVGEALNMVCNAAKICLGHTGFAQVGGATSSRDFKILGAGGFLLTEHMASIPFRIGEECATYTSPQDCIEKIEYYLTHEKERLRIAEAGYQAVHLKHTWPCRAAAIILDIRKLQNGE